MKERGKPQEIVLYTFHITIHRRINSKAIIVQEITFVSLCLELYNDKVARISNGRHRTAGFKIPHIGHGVTRYHSQQN